MKDRDLYIDELDKEESDFDIKKWFSRIFRAWYWFVLSVFLCLFCAWLYLHYTNPVYQAVAAVMIKDEKKGGDVADNSILKDLGVGSNKTVENEIEILKSYDLVEEVVKQEQLFVSFLAEGRVRDIPLFGNDLPFRLEILNTDSISQGVNWIISLNKKEISLNYNDSAPQKILYGGVYNFSGVRFQLMPNDAWRNAHKTDSISGSYFVRIVSVADATTSFSGRLGVDAVSKQASVVNLTINDSHRERAVRVLSTLIDIYNRQGLDDKNKVTANTIDFLNDRLKAVAADLQGVEGEVQRFKTSNQITDMSADAEQYLNMAKDIDLQRAESQTRLSIVEALEKDLLLNQDNPKLVPSTLGLEEVSLASLVEKHNALVLEKERTEKNKEFGPQNPRLIELTQQVQATRRNLLANVGNLKMAYQITLNDIARKDEQLKGRIRNMPQLERKLVEIKRNQNVEEQLYAFLLQKREEAAVTLASNIPDSRTIIKARGLGPVSPKSKMIWGIALVAGLVIPLVIMLSRDFLDNRVGDASEVEKKTKVPLLGMISHVKKISSPIVVSVKSRSVVAEQIRTLRTSIGFTGKNKEVKKILITSSQPGDGKSFVSLNLAASYALLGKKTLLVELDLRKPHVAKYLGIAPKDGISGILAGKSTLDEVLIEIPDYDQNMYLLPAGYLPPNPAELISGARMANLVKEMSERFDYIIIDTPPFGLVTDAVLLQQFMDVTLVVLRQGHTHKDAYAELNQRMFQKQDYSVYTVLNGVGWRKRYQHKYGYGKYSSYGYGGGYFEE